VERTVELFDFLYGFGTVEFVMCATLSTPSHVIIHNIERKWGELKAVIRDKKGIHDKQPKSHIAEFLWRERFGQNRKVFYNFWAQVAELYPCN
jgi:hypothetical protein